MKNLLLTLSLFISVLNWAAHIIGGEVYYDSLGNNQYRVIFELYRDCNGTGAQFDNPIYYTVFDAASNSVYSNYTIVLPTPDILPLIYDDPCVIPPDDICVQRAVYIDTITLPANAGGYYITHQRCCWAGNIQNIDSAVDWGITLTTFVPGTSLVNQFDNNAARFNNYPPIVLCSGQTLDFDHSAFDADGDSLVYSMCDVQTINVNDGIMPTTMYPGPYNSAPWAPSYSNSVPFGNGSSIVLDSETGAMQITPGAIGTYVAVVCVDEYRDGVLINSKSRTFGFRIVQCDVIIPIQVIEVSQGLLVEDCAEAGFIVTRDSTNSEEIVQVLITGTATNGVDYNYLADTLIMPIGVASDTISITPFFDNLTEGNETVEFSIIIENPCDGTFDTTTAYHTIIDYVPMSVSVGDSINICDEMVEFGMVWANVQNGAPPYNYVWYPTPYTDNDTVIFSASDINPNLNVFYVHVSDACGGELTSEPVSVYHQCPLGPPNVITPNGDETNDYFIIKNLEDYDRVKLTIINRWGNLIYENESYQNDWNGKSQNGNALNDGVYYYTVTPESDKFEYDDQEKTLYTRHGFFYILKD